MEKLASLLAGGEYGRVIELIRERLAGDRRLLADPEVKAWCGLRFRHLLLREAVQDPTAMGVARHDLGRRGRQLSDRRVIAERFLKGAGRSEGGLEMPATEERRLADTSILFCPGLLTGMLPVRAFADGFPVVEQRFGCRVIRADSLPLRSCQANTRNLCDAIDRGIGRAADGSLISPEQAVPPSGGLLVIAYSKGSPDLLTLLAARPELLQRIRCIFLWCGAVGGSQLASGIDRTLKALHTDVAEDKLLALLQPLIGRLKPGRSLRRLVQNDVCDAIHDLTVETRHAFLEEHAELLDSLDTPVFTAAASTSWAEVPWFQLSSYLKLRRYEADNDMQLTASATTLPSAMATPLALLHAHHWDAAYGRFPQPLTSLSHKLYNPFPRTAALMAMVTLAAELGLVT